MKLTFLFFLAGLLQLSASVYSQTTKLSLEMRNARVAEVLDAIENQSEFRFAYSPGLIDLDRKVTVKIRNKTIDESLKEIFTGAQVEYSVYDRHILLYPESMNPDAEPLVSHATGAQQRTVSGKVTDDTGQPLPGVTIVIKGTTRGTVTNADGEYSIASLPEDATLVFSFVGMRTEEVVVGDQTTINVEMVVDAIGIEEVVAIGYGMKKKENLTGAVSNVTEEVLESRPIVTIGQGLQGLIPNLNISQTYGYPGSGATFNVRGYTSINGGDPLILVDGVPMDVNMVNPDDVASVSVLKDAASAAIYGARAAYGVVLITTKDGKGEVKPKISVSTRIATNSPNYRYHQMSSVDRMNYLNNGNMFKNGTPYYDEYFQAAILAHYNDPSQPETFVHPNRAPNLWTYCANTDWADELLRDNYTMSQSNINVSGSTPLIDYYTSFSYLYEEGILKHFQDIYNRYNFSGNFNFKLNSWITLGTRFVRNASDKQVPPHTTTSSQQFEYWLPEGIPANYPIQHPTDGHYYNFGGYSNLVQLNREGGGGTRDINETWLTGSGEFRLFSNFKFNIDYSVNFRDTKYNYTVKKLEQYNRDGFSGYFAGSIPNRVERDDTENRYNAFNAYADYDNIFGEKHHFSGVIGFNQEFTSNHYFYAERRELITEEVPYMSSATGERIVNDSGSEYAIRGLFGRLNYIFNERYLLELNARYDGSSKFPKESRFEFYPSIALGWRLDNETFFSKLKNNIQMLKLRASYGTLGNQNVASYYPYVATMGSSEVSHILGGSKPMTVTAPGLVSPSLTWETVIQRNLGVDFAILNGSLTGSVDIFRRDTENMLTKSATLPSILAVSEPRENAADLRTSGFEVSLDWRHNVPHRNIRYGLMVTLSDYTSEITKYDNPQGLFSDYYVGKNPGEIWGLVTGGMFKTDEEARSYDQNQIDGRLRRAGDLWFEDLNGDGKITYGNNTLDNPGDRKIIGDNTPRYSFGVRPDIYWKGFYIDALFQGVLKRDMVLGINYFLEPWNSEWSTFNKHATDYWTEDNQDAYYPAPVVGTARDVIATQTHFMQNAAYMRLKQLTIGYDLPKSLAAKIFADKITVYFSGQNVWEITGMKVDFVDPEQDNARSYPLYRSLSLGLKVDF